MIIDTDELPPAEFDSSDHPERAVPKIFKGGPGRAIRLWEAEEWSRRYGSFGSFVASHGWHDWSSHRHQEGREYCQATVLTADLRCECPSKWVRDEPCFCVGDMVYLGACLWCDWEGEVAHDDENDAAEDALDHAWPGWRELPVLDRAPEAGTSATAKKKLAAWSAKLTTYPPGWLEQGGPIKTYREYMGNRHVPNHTPWGGYDVGILAEGALERWEEQQAKWKAERNNRLTGKRGSAA